MIGTKKMKIRSFMHGVPEKLFVEERKVESSLDKGNNVKQRVYYERIPIEEIDKQVLDPDVINAQSLLSQGMVISVENMNHLLDATDVATLEDAYEKFSGEALDYIEANKKELFPVKK